MMTKKYRQQIKKNGKIYKRAVTLSTKPNAQGHADAAREKGYYACVIPQKIGVETVYHVMVREGAEVKQPKVKDVVTKEATTAAVGSYAKKKISNKGTWIKAIEAHMDYYKIKEVEMNVTFPVKLKRTIAIRRSSSTWSVIVSRTTKWHSLKVLSIDMLKQISALFKSKHYEVKK